MFASCFLVCPEFSFFATLTFFLKTVLLLDYDPSTDFLTIIIFSETIFNVQLGINL